MASVDDQGAKRVLPSENNLLESCEQASAMNASNLTTLPNQAAAGCINGCTYPDRLGDPPPLRSEGFEASYLALHSSPPPSINPIPPTAYRTALLAFRRQAFSFGKQSVEANCIGVNRALCLLHQQHCHRTIRVDSRNIVAYLISFPAGVVSSMCHQS